DPTLLSQHEGECLANQENFDKDADENSSYGDIKENVQPPIENVRPQKANPKEKRKRVVSKHYFVHIIRY
ncbi:Hypothetical predicted protein, partial [Paramuricea clavata]